MTDRPDQILAQLLEAMAEAQIPVALLGGYAVTTWGIPRATYDVDALIDVDEARVGHCLSSLERHGFAVGEVYKTGWRDRIRDMPLIKAQAFRGGHGITNDLFLVTTPLQRSAFARSRLVRIPITGRDVRIVSAADLILFKLLADRPKDRLDVQNVLTVQGLPEPEYLRDWAGRLGIADRLDRAIADAGLDSHPG